VPQSATVVHPPLFLHLSDIISNYKEITIFSLCIKEKKLRILQRRKLID